MISPLVSTCFDSFRAPLVRLPENKYYVVALAGVDVVDPATGERLPCRRAPRYAIIDSGSNMMSVSSALLAELRGAGVRAAGGGRRLELALETTTGATRAGTLSYAPAQYAMGAQLLIRDNLPLDKDESEQFLILGSLFLRHLYLEVDVAAQTVLFGRQLCNNTTQTCRPSPAQPPTTPPPICVRRSTRVPHARGGRQKKVGRG